MNKKRLTREKGWGFQFFPYHQIYMNSDLFKGWVAINYFTAGETLFWDFKKAGKTPVCGKGMTWLTLIPDGKSRSVSAFFLPDRCVSAWYIDVIEEMGIDEDGVLYFIDKYLDVLLTPQGDVGVDDRDELDAAYASGDINEQQYKSALAEGELIIAELGSDIQKTEVLCRQILNKAEEMITDDRFTIFLDIDGVLDVFDPAKPVQELIPEAVSRLRELAERTFADIVIISDWRFGSQAYREKARELGFGGIIGNWEHLVKTFENAGLKISGVTPWDEKLFNRTAEIRSYLEQRPNIRRYVIFDDCFGDTYESDDELRKHLVFVDALKGLQDKDLISACKVMNMLK